LKRSNDGRKTRAKKTRKPSGKANQSSTAAPRLTSFVSRAAVEALHRESLAEHGGLDGIRDEGLLESALARCVNRAAYEPDSTIAQLAAALAFGLAKNHPFNDGNKRIALIASFLFVELNGFRVIATESDAYDTIYALAAGEIDESRLSEWFGQNMRRKRR